MWSMVKSQWSKVNGQKSMVKSQWSKVNGQKSMVKSQWSKVNIQRFRAANFTKFSFLFEKMRGKSAPVYLRAELSSYSSNNGQVGNTFLVNIGLPEILQLGNSKLDTLNLILQT